VPKKEKKPRKEIKAHEHYEVSNGKLSRKNKFCPKCGSAVFMARHKDRWTCGQCSYTEFEKK